MTPEKIAIQTVEHCIAILAEHPDNNKTQTARKILRHELMDFQNRVSVGSKFGHVALCACLSIGLIAIIFTALGEDKQVIAGSQLPRMELAYRDVK